MSSSRDYVLVFVNSSMWSSVNLLPQANLLRKENYVMVDVSIVSRLKDSFNRYSLCCWDGVDVIHELLS